MSQPKILIVDDRPENLYVLEKLLKKIDVDIVQTTSGIDALALCLDNDFCLAIVDVQMPEMDGYELVELLRGNESTATMPVIFVSAIYSDEYHHRKGYDAGAVDFLSKPFVPEILLSKVKVFLALYHQRQELSSLLQRNQELYDQTVAFNKILEQAVHARTTELEEAYQKLKLLDKSKSDFIQVLAHELRTPLAVVLGYSQMLAEEELVKQNKLMSLQAEGIVGGAERMHEMINVMLDMIKIENQAWPMLWELVHVGVVLTELQKALHHSLKERDITIHVDENVLELPMIQADEQSLYKLFRQLLINGIKYTPDGGDVFITGTHDTENEAIKVMIRDTGIGIAPEYQEVIFNKFFQTGEVALHSSGKTKFKGGGPGLGLAIAQGIATAHKGRIWVESSEYNEETLPGSTFHVVLPIQSVLMSS